MPRRSRGKRRMGVDPQPRSAPERELQPTEARAPFGRSIPFLLCHFLLRLLGLLQVLLFFPFEEGHLPHVPVDLTSFLPLLSPLFDYLHPDLLSSHRTSKFKGLNHACGVRSPRKSQSRRGLVRLRLACTTGCTSLRSRGRPRLRPAHLESSWSVSLCNALYLVIGILSLLVQHEADNCPLLVEIKLLILSRWSPDPRTGLGLLRQTRQLCSRLFPPLTSLPGGCSPVRSRGGAVAAWRQSLPHRVVIFQWG